MAAQAFDTTEPGETSREREGSIGRLLIACVLGVFFFVLTTAPAKAGPGQSATIASAKNVETANFNPAGLTRIPNTQLAISPLIAYTELEFKIDKKKTTVSGGDGKDSSLVVVPGIYFGMPLSEKWRFGFSLSVPSGIGADYGDDWAGRYQTQKSTLAFVGLTPVLAYRVNDWLSLGGGPSLTYTISETESAINNRLDGRPDGKMKQDGDSFSVRGILSALVEFSPSTRLGLVYRTEGDSDLEGEPDLKGVGPILMLALIKAGLIGHDLSVGMNLPQVVQLGLYHEFESGVSVEVDAGWIEMERFGKLSFAVGEKSLTYDLNYKNMWTGSIGVTFPLTDAWTGSAGFSYYTEAVDDEDRTFSLPLDRVIMAGVGIERRLSEKLNLEVSFDYFDLGKAPIDRQLNSLSGRVAGEFDKHHAYGINAHFIWDF